MEVPENCRECPFGHDCKAWHYGGDKCAFKKEITEKQNA